MATTEPFVEFVAPVVVIQADRVAPGRSVPNWHQNIGPAPEHCDDQEDQSGPGIANRLVVQFSGIAPVLVTVKV